MNKPYTNRADLVAELALGLRLIRMMRGGDGSDRVAARNRELVNQLYPPPPDLKPPILLGRDLNGLAVYKGDRVEVLADVGDHATVCPHWNQATAIATQEGRFVVQVDGWKGSSTFDREQIRGQGDACSVHTPSPTAEANLRQLADRLVDVDKQREDAKRLLALVEAYGVNNDDVHEFEAVAVRLARSVLGEGA